MNNEYKIEYINISLFGNQYFIPSYAKDRPAAATMINGYYYEKDTHRFVHHILRETGKSMVHGGTFFGDMIPSFASECKGTLYAFEPVLENYVLARKCVQQNNLTNVILFNAAMSDKTGYAYMQTYDNGHMGGSSQITEDDSKKTQLVNTLCLDDINMNELSIVHLDLENHEPWAIKGGIEVINNDTPIVIMEDYHNKAGDVLQTYGYEYIDKLQFGPHNWLNIWSTNKYKDLCNQTLNILNKPV